MQDWHYFAIMGIILIIIEAFTPTFIFAPIGIAFLITSLAAVFIDSLAVLFLILLLSIILVWYGLQKTELRERLLSSSSSKKSGLDGMLGKEVLVSERINPSNMTGSIKLYGDIWHAISHNNMAIEVGQKVKIINVDGNKVYVELIV